MPNRSRKGRVIRPDRVVAPTKVKGAGESMARARWTPKSDFAAATPLHIEPYIAVPIHVLDEVFQLNRPASIREPNFSHFTLPRSHCNLGPRVTIAFIRQCVERGVKLFAIPDSACIDPLRPRHPSILHQLVELRQRHPDIG